METLNTTTKYQTRDIQHNRKRGRFTKPQTEREVDLQSLKQKERTDTAKKCNFGGCST
jgi:hypothetical protein